MERFKRGIGGICGAAVTVLSCLVPFAARAQKAPGRVTVVQDLLPLVARAAVQNASTVEVKNATPAGGVLQNALFEHPKAVGASARVTFPLRLPALAPGERLLFAFEVALSDGVPWKTASPAPDGAGFAVEVNGKPAYSQVWKQSRWYPGAVDLTARAGQDVRLSLVVDPLTIVNYDWALWGRPRLLRVRTAPLATSKNAPATTKTTIGLLVADAAYPLRRLRLTPDKGEPIEWKREGTDKGSSLAAFEYQFPDAQRVRVEAEPAGAGIRLATAAFEPHLRIETVSCVRALPLVGERTALRVTVRNMGPGVLPAGRAAAGLTQNGAPLPSRLIGRLAPGRVWRGEWSWRAAKAGRIALVGSVMLPADTKVKAPAPLFRSGTAEAFLPPRAGDRIANRHLRLEFVRSRDGYAGAIIRARRGKEWVSTGSLDPLFRIAHGKSDPLWELRPTTLEHGTTGASSGSLTALRRDSKGVLWHCTLTVALASHSPVARLRYEWRPDSDTAVYALWGPNVYVGDGTVGEASSGALFPGLEFLSGGEPSSSGRGFAPPLGNRFTPTAEKVTIPLMAVAIGADSVAPPLNPERFYCPDSLKDQSVAKSRRKPGATAMPPLTVSLLWDTRALASARPSARFCSPNFQEGMANHRLGLFLPSCPEFVNENEDRSRSPYALSAGKTVALTATLAVTVGQPLTAVRSWLREQGGLPAPASWPRSKEAAFALSRDGLMQTVWNPKTRLWRSSVESPEEPIPGIASLLYLDSRTAGDPETALRSQQQMNEGIAAIQAKGGPGSLFNRASSHIMRWELPFFYGYLPQGMDELEKEIRQIQQAQQPDGGWRFRAGDPQRASLGKAGDGVCGLASHHAWMLLRYARITDDPSARAAGERALLWIERFRVPRGASVWECPIYEPDILAADWNLAACLEGYQATGNKRWLHDAVYWAETGLPFIYLWSRPDCPAMQGASIATFGSTFYTHTWLATPVQWEGLIYGYNLLHLANALEKADGEPATSPLPLSLAMTPGEWRRLADLVFVSGLHQQVAEGPNKGTYPDSITDFVRPNPVFINPENLMVHLLTREGHDPDIKTVQIPTSGGTLRVSSEAQITGLASGRNVRLRVRYFTGSNSQLLVIGPSPKVVLVEGKPLTKQTAPLQKETGWSRDERKKSTYLSIPHPMAETSVELQF